jgi:NAD(P)-dependent dehydrogenase (short-subunit alcohol dehydrogenase family)
MRSGTIVRHVNPWTLGDKVVLITGGARGIGAGTGRELARRGARVVLADLDAEALTATAATISPAPLTIDLDVTDEGACEAAVEQVLATHGRLDIAWANAGIASFGPLALSAPSAWRRTIEVNVLGAYNTLRAALPAVIDRRGYLAVTASVASFGHAPGMSAYSTSKAGVEAMCNSLRLEVAHLGVDVGSIHPSWIDTDMVREGDEAHGSFAPVREAMRPPFKRTYPLSRAVADIVAGFDARKRRICTPRFVLLAHILRPLLTTPAFERDLRAAAPEITRLFEAEVAERGAEGASTSERIAGQLHMRETGTPS